MTTENWSNIIGEPKEVTLLIPINMETLGVPYVGFGCYALFTNHVIENIELSFNADLSLFTNHIYANQAAEIVLRLVITNSQSVVTDLSEFDSALKVALINAKQYHQELLGQ